MIIINIMIIMIIINILIILIILIIYIMIIIVTREVISKLVRYRPPAKKIPSRPSTEMFSSKFRVTVEIFLSEISKTKENLYSCTAEMKHLKISKRKIFTKLRCLCRSRESLFKYLDSYWPKLKISISSG